MNIDDFRRWSHQAADWAADYHQGLRERPVRAQVAPGEIAAQIADTPPEQGEPFEAIFADFERIIPPGMTHWQHPRFFAYFPSNAALESIIAEQLAGAMSAQGMLWQTSPALTELETRMTDWLRQAVGLPGGFQGVLQDTASMATLCAMLCMRERALQGKGNRAGLAGGPRIRIYASEQTHSSIDKATWLSGIGQDNLVKIRSAPGHPWPVDVPAMAEAIRADRAAGYRPAGIIGCVGGTSIGGCDDIAALAALARAEDLYLHVDAAWAGSAMIVPEYRGLWAGIDQADSIVFNPHKWLGVPMECSAHFVRDPDLLVSTLAIQPEYLKTHGKDGLINYSEWSVTLGRRFRALKLWFLLRHQGLEGLRERMRNHVNWAQALARRIADTPGFELVTEPVLSLFSFRYAPVANGDLNALNLELLTRINDDGRTYLTQTKVGDKLAIRFQVGPFETTEEDVGQAFEVVREIAGSLQPGTSYPGNQNRV
ncbi:MAG: pyridoxal-dependent decarboxylase [Burkholderiaceae bacterium]